MRDSLGSPKEVIRDTVAHNWATVSLITATHTATPGFN